MKHFNTLVLLLVFGISALAQLPNPNQILLSFNHRAGGDTMVLNETIFTIWNGKQVSLSRADFYVSEIEVDHTNIPLTPLTDQYMLVRANSPNDTFDLGIWPVDAVHAVNLHLGIPQAVNHNDPASWPGSHPLAPQNPSMHWGWAAGYIFMAINGKVDNDNDGIPEAYFEYHNVGDALFRKVELHGGNLAQNGVLHLNLVLDYEQLFKNLSLDTFLHVHGSGNLNRTMLDNAANEQFLRIYTPTATNDVVKNSLQVQASPNPANTETWVSYDLPASAPLQLTLTNVLGQTVFTRTNLPPSGTARLETTTLPGSLYQCAFYESGRLIARKKLVVRH